MSNTDVKKINKLYNCEESRNVCFDENRNCPYWAKTNKCKRNQKYDNTAFDSKSILLYFFGWVEMRKFYLTEVKLFNSSLESKQTYVIKCYIK